MTVLWCVLAVLLALAAAGLGLTCFVCLRRPIPNVTDPDILEKTHWNRYRDSILAGSRWLSGQDVQPLQVMSYDGKLLYGRFVACENARGTILMFHGYRSTHAVDFSAVLEYYNSLGFHMLICDQRAHGLSQGKFITFGIRERYDVMSWVTYLTMMLGEEHPIILDGLSMGATTVLMASDMEFPGNVRGIIADSGFTSPGDIIRHLLKTKYHLPPKPVAALLNIFTKLYAGFGLEEWATTRALENTTLPVLLLHGLADDFVPSWMSDRAFEACAGPKTILKVPGADHGASYLMDMPRCQTALEQFLNEVL